MPIAYPTSSTLRGVRELNIQGGLVQQQEDAWSKIAGLISAVNALVSNVTLLQTAAASANVSAVTFSSLSGVTFTAYTGVISNFRS